LPLQPQGNKETIALRLISNIHNYDMVERQLIGKLTEPKNTQFFAPSAVTATCPALMQYKTLGHRLGPGFEKISGMAQSLCDITCFFQIKIRRLIINI